MDDVVTALAECKVSEKPFPPISNPLKKELDFIKKVFEIEYSRPELVKAFEWMLVRTSGTVNTAFHKFVVPTKDLSSERVFLYLTPLLFLYNTSWQVALKKTEDSTFDLLVVTVSPSCIYGVDFATDATCTYTNLLTQESHEMEQTFTNQRRVLLLKDIVTDSTVDHQMSIKLVLSNKSKASEKKKSNANGCVEKPIKPSYWTYTTDSRCMISDQDELKLYPSRHLLHVLRLFTFETFLTVGDAGDWLMVVKDMVKRWVSYDGPHVQDTLKLELTARDRAILAQNLRDVGFITYVMSLLNGEFIGPHSAQTYEALMGMILLFGLDKHLPANMHLSKVEQETLLTQCFLKVNSPSTTTTFTLVIVCTILPGLIRALLLREAYGGGSGSSGATLLASHTCDIMVPHFSDYVSYNLEAAYSRVMLMLARERNALKQEDCWGIFSGDHHVDTFSRITLEVLKKGKLNILPEETAKLMLSTIIKNKINPFFARQITLTAGSYTFPILSKLIYKWYDRRMYNYWIQLLVKWCKLCPLSFDLLMPSPRLYQVPLTAYCGCFDETGMDMINNFSLFYKLYTGHMRDVIMPLKNIMSKKNVHLPPLQSLEKLKDEANEHYYKKHFEKAIEKYSGVVEHLLNYKLKREGFTRTVNGKSVRVPFPESEILLTKCRNNIISSYCELGRHEDVLQESIVALNDIDLLLLNNKDAKLPKHSGVYQPLVKRKFAIIFKRVKALTALNHWRLALLNVLPLIYESSFRKESLSYYYKALFQYICDSGFVQFPYQCIICSNKIIGGNNSYKSCEDCGHPYCSQMCLKDDEKTHRTHCVDLKRAISKSRRGYGPTFSEN